MSRFLFMGVQEDPEFDTIEARGNVRIYDGTKPARKITDVMERIRPLLVEGGVDMTAFDEIEHALGFAAPEMHPGHWLPLCEWLAKTLPNPTLPDAPAWVKEVSAIVEGRSA